MVDLTGSRMTKTHLSFRILTHNIRYATDSPFKGEVPWPERREIFLSHLHYHTQHLSNTLICLQEVLHEQLIDIETSLGPSWQRVGVGRDDGQKAGEYSPIFFQHDQWTLDYFETIWLNEDGAVGHRGWDAASVRILTCAVLIHHETSRKVLAMNTHLDDQGQVARLESTNVILRTVRRLRQDHKIDWWFLAGDLNTGVEDDAYRNLNGLHSGFVDAKRYIDITADRDHTLVYGDESTFTGFENDQEELKRIDFVHLGTGHEDFGGLQNFQLDLSRRPFQLKSYSVLPNVFESGTYMSDHRAVAIDVII